MKYCTGEEREMYREYSLNRITKSYIYNFCDLPFALADRRDLAVLGVQCPLEVPLVLGCPQCPGVRGDQRGREDQEDLVCFFLPLRKII